MVYQMVRISDELDQVDQNELVSISDFQIGFLLEVERFFLKIIFLFKNMEFFKFFGLIVNIFISFIGKSLFVFFCLGFGLLVLCGFLRVGVGESGKVQQLFCCWIGRSVILFQSQLMFVDVEFVFSQILGGIEDICGNVRNG